MTATRIEQTTGVFDACAPVCDPLDDLDVLRRIEHETSVDVLTVTAQFMCEHREESIDPVRARLPGRQRATSLGGAGTPKVAEFAPALVAGRLGLSPWAGARLCADVLDLQYRLPLLWAALGRYEALARLARHVAKRTRDLTSEQAAVVDARVVESADGRLAWNRFSNLVEAVIGEVDADTIRQREEDALTEQFAKPTRSTVHGMRGFYIQAPFPVIARLDATVAYLADALAIQGHAGPLDERRVLAVLLMANPAQALALMQLHQQGAAKASTSPTAGGPTDEPPPEDHAGVGGLETGLRPCPSSGESDRPVTLGDIIDQSKLLPHVTLYVHLSDDPTGIARVEGLENDGPITAAWVQRWLGPHCRFTIRPVFMPAAQTPVDAWEVPDRHREAVHLMSPADVFPWAANTTRSVQIDHTVPYDTNGPPGQSAIGNYGPLTTFHHRLKTHGGWQVAQPFPGIYIWRDPSGATYLVDHTGSRRLFSS